MRFGLHPTFGCDYIDVKPESGKNDISLSRIGWGTFDIPITVFWKRNLKKEIPTFNHYLHLDGNGKWTTISMFFNKNLI